MKLNVKNKCLILILLIFLSCTPIKGSAKETSSDLSDSNILRTKYNSLYESDEAFKKAVDECRRLLREEKFGDEEWLKYMVYFDQILVKLGLSTLQEMDEKQLSVFRKLVEEDAQSWKFIQLEGEYLEETPISRLSDEEELEIAEDYIPRLYQPTYDVEAPRNNGFWKSYINVWDSYIYGYYLPGTYIIELSLVWYDEDMPALDEWWDTQRMNNWGRIEDIETFYIVVDKTAAEVDRASFIPCEIYKISGGTWKFIQPCWGRNQGYWSFGYHHEAKVDSDDLLFYGEHPKIWVNTWNHLMHQRNKNIGWRMTTYVTWQETYEHGSRYEAENDVVESTWYSRGRLTKSP